MCDLWISFSQYEHHTLECVGNSDTRSLLCPFGGGSCKIISMTRVSRFFLLEDNRTCSNVRFQYLSRFETIVPANVRCCRYNHFPKPMSSKWHQHPDISTSCRSCRILYVLPKQCRSSPSLLRSTRPRLDIQSPVGLVLSDPQRKEEHDLQLPCQSLPKPSRNLDYRTKRSRRRLRQRLVYQYSARL